VFHPKIRYLDFFALELIRLENHTSQTIYAMVSPRFIFRPELFVLKRRAICTWGKLLASE